MISVNKRVIRAKTRQNREKTDLDDLFENVNVLLWVIMEVSAGDMSRSGACDESPRTLELISPDHTALTVSNTRYTHKYIYTLITLKQTSV